MTILGLYNYWIYAFVLVVGLYAVLVKGNYVKRLIGLGIFQGAVFLLYISMDKVEGGTGPIFVTPPQPGDLFANPLPQVLILTAIVVGIAVTALGLAITIRIKEEYGTIEESEIRDMDRQA
ncbi:MAG: cation:proton antiporter subunit C [Hydrogenophaga sp.]|uniref:cation:proton antiporter subunit C n=1 Tax=Hydrogenophaga sp. TaxID=1904254 RepID=UPI00277552E8|nr:cation:proton antiporter subunit C [Hydrogenophaga sp.]MDP2416036.1 cation:proton antiporter subunit C [Hydrogenophaga sp.]MDZ4189949.1 cation:proton antiporter subunit C [Hydrogenophaga sp.]